MYLFFLDNISTLVMVLLHEFCHFNAFKSQLCVELKYSAQREHIAQPRLYFWKLVVLSASSFANHIFRNVMMCMFIKMYGITNLQSVHFTVHIFSCNKIESNAGRIQIKSSNITYSIYPVPQLDNPKQAARAACLALPWQLVSFL